MSFLFLTQQPRIVLLAFPKIYFQCCWDLWWRWIDEIVQRLENADQTHLVLASGKLVQQKVFLHVSLKKVVAKKEKIDKHR